MTNEQTVEYVKSQLCCDSQVEMQLLVGLMAGHISRRVQPGWSARKVLVKLLRDAEKWNRFKELLGD